MKRNRKQANRIRNCVYLSYIVIGSLGGVMDIVLAIGPIVFGFKPDQEQRVLKGDQIRNTASSGGVVKPLAPCRKILCHVKYSLRCDRYS
jgi:hypothetical protein